MGNTLPRLLLISEATLDEKATGLNRTLFNLLVGYPTDRFMLCAPEEALKTNPPAPPFGQHVTSLPRQVSLPWRNRIAAWLSPLVSLLNLQRIDLLPIPNVSLIQAFDPEVILICPNTPLALIIGYRIAKFLQRPFLIYFMDDWVATSQQKWLGGSIQAYCQNLLRDAVAWMVISPQLEESLIKRYGVKPKRSLVVHNPVNLSNVERPNFTSHHRERFQIAYAGSIWTMHYDAVAVVAEAIHLLRQDRYDIELVLYTQEGFWAAYQNTWEAWDVVYGGLVPYDKLHSQLQQADLLLVASSFLPKYANITRSSVQTKITDYMATGKPILSCGPQDGACNMFIRQWNCGLVCETNNISKVKDYLLKQIQNRGANQVLAKNAYQVLLEHFETNKVHQKLYEFIRINTAQVI
jgi:glycosyltransferase involved in cell wall biosynthesis